MMNSNPTPTQQDGITITVTTTAPNTTDTSLNKSGSGDSTTTTTATSFSAPTFHSSVTDGASASASASASSTIRNNNNHGGNEPSRHPPPTTTTTTTTTTTSTGTPSTIKPNDSSLHSRSSAGSMMMVMSSAPTPTTTKRNNHTDITNPDNDQQIVNEKIVDPNIEDVLCGRGGMSNHHPGNEWYRRLIRSNRNLYRACPKHTKLLVAKAIVQAVQEQNGRFLERDLQTGVWYTISYKRAVDKTSQGLREKERDIDFMSGNNNSGGKNSNNNNKKKKAQIDMKSYLKYPTDQDDDDDNDDDNDNSGDTNNNYQNNYNNGTTTTATTTEVPYAFSAKASYQQYPINLSELAQVAVQNTQNHAATTTTYTANTTSTTTGSKSNIHYNNNDNKRNCNKKDIATKQQRQLPILKSALKKQSNPTRTTTTTSGMSVSNAATTTTTPAVASVVATDSEPLTPVAYSYWLQQQHQQQQQLQQQLHSQSIGVDNNYNVTTAATSMQQAQLLRDISMYRLLKHTQLLPAQTSMLLQMNHDNNNNNSQQMNLHSNISGVEPQQQQDLVAAMMMMNQGSSNSNNNNNDNVSQMFQNAMGNCINEQHQQGAHSIYQGNNNNANSSSSTTALHSNTTGTVPAGLTRLTSQVSDWLNFFWPTTNHNNSNDNNVNNTAGISNDQYHNNYSNINHTTGTISVSINHASPTATTPMCNRQLSENAAVTIAAANDVATSAVVPSSSSLRQIKMHASAEGTEQQQEQQQSDVTAESLLQLHRQLSNDIDSTPFTSLFHTNSSLSQQTSLPFFFPTISNEQQQQRQSNTKNDGNNLDDRSKELNDSGTTGSSNTSSNSNNKKRRHQAVDDEDASCTMNLKPQHRSYLIPIPPEDSDQTDLQHRLSKQPKISHHLNTTTDEGITNVERTQHGQSTVSAIAGTKDSSSTTVPSELEQSVSLTLLKLAESPSKLFSGLSSFFGTNPSTTMTATNNGTEGRHSTNSIHMGQQQAQQYPMLGVYESALIHQSQSQQQQQQNEPATTKNTDTVFTDGISATISGQQAQIQRKSQSSLLDDVEETPMEQRMRSLHQYA